MARRPKRSYIRIIRDGGWKDDVVILALTVMDPYTGKRSYDEFTVCLGMQENVPVTDVLHRAGLPIGTAYGDIKIVYYT